MTKLIDAVLYLRMSRLHQDKSIPEQRASAHRYAKKHGYRIIREYIDEGISGDDTEKRIGFLAMVSDAAAKGDFRAILCWDQDRFGRFNSLEAGFYVHPLMKANVTLVALDQGPIDWHDFTGRIMYALKQEAKNQFLRDLSRNSLRGLIARARKGQWGGGVPPYGYVVGPDKHLELGDSQRVDVVRRIFHLRVSEQVGYRVIARRLNIEGIAGPAGHQWSHDAVRTVLARETYCGVITLGGRRQGRYFTTDNNEVTPVGKVKRRTDPVRVEDAHPAIIDAATFAAVQALRSKHPKPHWRNNNEGAPLAGLLKCGCCGSTMYSQSLARKAGQKSPSYICGKYHKGHGCGYCAVPQAAMLCAVAKVIRAKVLMGSPKALEVAIAAEIAKRKPPESDQAGTDRQLRELDRKIANATERLVSIDASLVPMIEAKLIDLQRQRNALATARKTSKANQQVLDPKAIAAHLWQLDAVLAEAGPSKVRSALSQIIESIDVNFVPAPSNGRGKRFSFENAVINPRSQQCAPPATCP